MRILRLLGLARRAGKLALGDAQTLKAVREGRAAAVCTASDAAANTQNRAKNAAVRNNIPHLHLPVTRAELGAALGVESCAITAILDGGFAAAAAKAL